MVRLIDRLARERRFYPAPTLAAPGVMVIDVPPALRGPGLPLGRYYPIAVETLAEREELEAYLLAERTADVVPDLFDIRASALQSDLVLVWRYEPPEPSWPWITLYRWPPAHQHQALESGVAMARGCYTIELFGSKAEADESDRAILTELGRRHQLEVRFQAGESLPPPGQA